MADHPRSVTFAEARAVLEAFGWAETRVRGSHVRFTRGSSSLIVPIRRPTILPIYVALILDATREEPPT